MRTLLQKYNSRSKFLIDWIFRILPVAALATLASYIAAKQTVTPHHRVLKLAVLFGLMGLMLRFDMVYSVFVFMLLFPYPSGISIGSTNSVLMTLIPLVWAIRATSTGTPIVLRRTSLDVPIILFTFAYIVSFSNVEEPRLVINGVKVMWRQLSCFAFFYMIVFFVDDEKKLMKMLKVMGVTTGTIMFTAVMELFLPGVTIIPGWISLSEIPGQGTLTSRIEGIRVGGALSSHGMLSDFATQMMFIVGFLTWRARNPLEKFVWFSITLMTFVALLGTANRGAFFGFVWGVMVFLYLFRREISPVKMIIALSLIIGTFVGAQLALDKYTYAASLTDRLMGTKFEGVVPDTRTMTWRPTIERSMEHPFLGHGPYLEPGIGLERMFWPHNAYLYYLYTIGTIGLGMFMFVVYRVFRLALMHRLAPKGSELGRALKILTVTFAVMLLEQLRTDHQRDDIYPYIVWMEFGAIAAAANLVRDKYAQARGMLGGRADRRVGVGRERTPEGI